MKSLASLLTLAIAIFFAFALAPATSHSGGCSSTSNSCGGNFSATEFKDLMSDAISALRQLRTHGPIVIEHLQKTGEDERVDVVIDPEVLNKAFSGVSVVEGRLYIDGKLVDFRSNPKSGHVDFTEKNWLNNPERSKHLRMVIHELLMLSSKKHPEYDDYLYNEQLSRGLLERIQSEESLNQPCVTREPQHPVVEKLAAQSGSIVSTVGTDVSSCLGSDYWVGEKHPVQFKCKTLSGALYERVSSPLGESWRGPDGVIWGEVFGELDYQGAQDACRSRGGRIPTLKELRTLNGNGFANRLPEDSAKIWTRDGNSDQAYAANPSNVDSPVPAKSDELHSVRCVKYSP